MFKPKYEDRLQSWNCLRQNLETSSDPIQDIIDAYRQAPKVQIHADPWDKNTWPNPWELINENQYDDFCTVLGQCYSLQLTDRFSGSEFEIHIGIDKESSRTCYLLLINKTTVIGWDESYVDINELPTSYNSQKVYVMPPLQ